MSASFFLNRPGDHPDETFSWDATSGAASWVIYFIADRVRDQEVAAFLRETPTLIFALAKFDDEQAADIVRIIREDMLPAAEAVSAAHPDNYLALFVRDLVEGTIRWSDGKDFWVRRAARQDGDAGE
ncbi:MULTISPECIES: hypothetical protein [unclassified Saccharothrix]|uniref:hypothetical protein n=1 Tax=unclassified Saccharothrix TaxID=2593673 RepID=UPI00307E48EA